MASPDLPDQTPEPKPSPAPCSAVVESILTGHASGPLKGVFETPGDKSISHRALIFGALATGETRIEGLLLSDDIMRTAEALRSMGAQVEPTGTPDPAATVGSFLVRGRGVQGLTAPKDVLDFGNAGTGVRLMLGVLAGHPFAAHLTGDHSLRRRPMGRVVTPLRMMGLEADLCEGDRLPAMVRGADRPLPIRYEVPVPSAQVKSAILLAGLHAAGQTEVREATATRDHTERMLKAFGASVTSEPLRDGGSGQVILLEGQPELIGRPIEVPGDPSSAAFGLVAGLIVPGSSCRVTGVMLNPARTGLLDCLEEMGAAIDYGHKRESGGEEIADLSVEAPAALNGIHVPPERAPSMIDEYPILAIAAANAQGRSRFDGLGELRVKESDRLSATARGLAACGVSVEIEGDSLVIDGCGPGGVPGGGRIDSDGDHRIAMAFAILGLASKTPVTVTGAEMIATSFPRFRETMAALGADLRAS